MDKKVIKAVRRDCHRIMWPCYVFDSLSTLLKFIVPTVSAWLIGDMTNALLVLDADYISTRIFPFFIAIILEAVVLPLSTMLDSMVIVKQAGRYEVSLMERLLHRPLSALSGETGTSVAEHTIVHAPDYYYIQMGKFSLPVIILIYGGTLLRILYVGELHILYVLAIMLLAAVPLLRTALIGRRNAKLAAEQRKYETDRAQKEESLFHARSFFRANHLEGNCLSGFHQRFADWYSRSGKKKNSVEAVRAVFSYINSYGTYLGAILAGSLLVWAGQMSVGALMTGCLLLPTLTSVYSTISSQMEEIQKEKDSQERLTVFYGKNESDLKDMESGLPQNVQSVRQLCLSHVAFTYPGESVPVFSDWSGTFSGSETFHIEGKNGSGKTTLMRLLSGLYAPQSGTITGENGTVLSKEALRSLMTIQEQDGCIFQGTVWDNLFTDDTHRGQAQACLDSLGFGKPLEYSVTAEAGNLSPGERQKILLTRALLRERTFLILDEPLNNMDEAGTRSLLDQLQKRKCGLILVTHQDIPLSADKINTIELVCQVSDG